MSEVNRLTFETIREAMASNDRESHRNHFISTPEGMVMYFGKVSGVVKRFLNPSSPYLIEDYRFGMVRCGEIHGRVNLIDYHATAGTAIFVTPGSILEPLSISDDLDICGAGMTSEVFHAVCRYHIPELFNGMLKNGVLQLPEEILPLTNNLLEMLWQLLHSKGSSIDVRYSMASTIVNHYSDIFSSLNRSQSHRRPAANEIFDRFIYLVNNNAREHHQLDFYADKMCITDRYLGTIVRQVSGVTAKEWIDRAIVTAAKVMLKHSNRQIVQISDELNFPNPSFFCKYFKRLVGYTPQEYRDK